MSDDILTTVQMLPVTLMDDFAIQKMSKQLQIQELQKNENRLSAKLLSF
jgi:hypothetical protein